MNIVRIFIEFQIIIFAFCISIGVHIRWNRRNTLISVYLHQMIYDILLLLCNLLCGIHTWILNKLRESIGTWSGNFRKFISKSGCSWLKNTKWFGYFDDFYILICWGNDYFFIPTLFVYIICAWSWQLLFFFTIRNISRYVGIKSSWMVSCICLIFLGSYIWARSYYFGGGITIVTDLFFAFENKRHICLSKSEFMWW